MMKNKTGFTMVEMLMVMGIMSILVVILSQVFGAILTMKLRSQATTAVAQDGRYAISRLAYDVARASDITSGSGGTLRLLIGGTSYVYQREGTTLVLSVGGGASQALTSIGSQITALNFTHFADMGGKKSVQINLTIAASIIQSGGATLARSLTTTVATR